MCAAKSRRWIVSFLAGVLVIVLLLSGIAYIIDPFFQFRVRDNSYMLSGWFVAGGLIKNYDYDTLILGSSMIQNFDMKSFRDELGVKPLHIGLNAMRTSEIIRLMNTAYAAGKARAYYICIDLPKFSEDPKDSRIAEHLLDEGILSKMRYLLSYEVWFRYIPIDMCFVLMDWAHVNLPIKYAYSKSIDKLEDWRLDYTFGKKTVLDDYRNGKFGVSTVDTDTEDLYLRMVSHIDMFLDDFDFENSEYVFFFPPYSSLYWCVTQNGGYFDVFLKAKQYFVERVETVGATTYDFQCADFTTDLENYKDMTHYRPEINDWMVKCFANKEYISTKDNTNIFQEKLIENTNSFREKNQALFYNQTERK